MLTFHAAVATLVFGSILTPIVAVASECPVVNGRFYKDYLKEGHNFRRVNLLRTRFENGKYSYQFKTDASFYPADGKWRPASVAAVGNQVRVTCTSKSIRFEIQDEQTRDHSYKSYRIVDERNIFIDTDMDAVRGVFVREE